MILNPDYSIRLQDALDRAYILASKHDLTLAKKLLSLILEFDDEVNPDPVGKDWDANSPESER